jgi:RNA polymerase sigma factor (TIGR02999 family)
MIKPRRKLAAVGESEVGDRRCGVHRVFRLGRFVMTMATELDPSEVTRVLDALQRGEPKVSSELLPLVYAELRSLAAKKLGNVPPGQTLQPTALVHEAYLRLVGSGQERSWDSRGHFYAAAAEAMRRILLDRARDKKRLKRGGGRKRMDIDLDELFGDDAPADDVIDLDEALTELAAVDSQSAQVVKLRVFAGLTLHEISRAMGIGRRTVDRDWAFARAWLYEQIVMRDVPTDD